MISISIHGVISRAVEELPAADVLVVKIAAGDEYRIALFPVQAVENTGEDEPLMVA